MPVLNIQCDCSLIWFLLCEKARWEAVRPKQDFQVSLSIALEPLAGPCKERFSLSSMGQLIWGKTDFGGVD